MYRSVEKLKRMPVEKRRVAAFGIAGSLTFFIIAAWLLIFTSKDVIPEQDNLAHKEEAVSPIELMRHSASEIASAFKGFAQQIAAVGNTAESEEESGTLEVVPPQTSTTTNAEGSESLSPEAIQETPYDSWDNMAP